MPQLTLTNDQKAQLVGWLNREKDFLLSIKAMAERIVIPSVTQTLELIKRDLEFVIRLRTAIRESDTPAVEISDLDSETLVDVARSNNYVNRDEFWRSIVAAVAGSEAHEPL